MLTSSLFSSMTVLLLNASSEPLSVIPKRRALSLLLRGRVVAATDETTPLRATTTAVDIPTILRLRRYVNVPRRNARWSRRGVLDRDKFECIYCGIMLGQRQRGSVVTKKTFTVDHIVPRCRGGKNTWGNTACACARCNNRKADKMPNEAGMHLRWEPKIPRVDYLIVGGEIPDSWKIYLEVPSKR